MNERTKHYPLIPEEERKCVWMTTGVIYYKLCDRDHQCESCPFDAAIKTDGGRKCDFPGPESDWAEGSCSLDPSDRISSSFFYHPDHCWAKVESTDKVRIGLDDILIKLITQIEVVILPQVGSVVEQGEYCAHIIQEDHILPVVSPLSGVVLATNSRLNEEPKLIVDDPRGVGWLLTIRPKNLEMDLKKLLFGREALRWHYREEQAILGRVETLLKQHPPAVGPTMQDGGVRITRLRDLLAVVTPKQRAQILDFVITRRNPPAGRGPNLSSPRPSSGR